MKLSKRIGLIVGIAVFAIVLGILGHSYSRQLGEQRELTESLSAAQALLPTLIAQRKDLEERVAEAEASLGASQAIFPESVQSIEYGERLFSIAERWKVVITSITTRLPADQKAETVTYSVAPFVVGIRGSEAAMLNFIHAIRTDPYFVNATVEVVNMTIRPEPLTPEEMEELTPEEIEERQASSSTINLVIYGYEGD